MGRPANSVGESRPSRIPCRSGKVRSHAWPPVALAHLAALLAGGCQSYEPRPLDLDATRAAWLVRSPSDDSVREFAAALDRAEGRSPSKAFDADDGLTLAEGEAVALVFNPALRQARLEANVARAVLSHAGLWQDPVLGVGLERIVSSASGGGGANRWVAGSTLGLTIPISGRLEAEKARAGAELGAALDRLAATEWATRSALRELWIEWSAARVRADITEAFIARLHDVAGLADRQEQAGLLTRVDARLFHVELAGREADAIAATARVKELELQLWAMLGVAPETPFVLEPTVAFAPRTTLMDDLRSLLDSANPELAAIRAEYELSERTLRAEVRKQYPDLAIGPGYGEDQGDQRVLLGLSLAIPLWNRNQQGVAHASAQREAARGRFEASYEQLSSRLAIAMARWESGRARRTQIESSLLPLADEQDADVRRVAALGRVAPLLLLESLKAQHDAKLRLVEARASESIGAVRLDELIGPPTHGQDQPGEAAPPTAEPQRAANQP